MGDLPSPKPDKTSWPELVGTGELHAGLTFWFERRDLTVIFLNLGEAPPPDYNDKRVVVFVDANQRVVFIPTIG